MNDILLSGFLASSYRQYKEDTDAIASWLAKTARRCGYPADLIQQKPQLPMEQPPQPGPSKKLKGKARMLAKAAGASRPKLPASSAQAEPSVTPSYIIAVNDFITLADFIAAKPSPRVPKDIFATLNRAIKVRQKHSQALLSQENVAKVDKSSVARHSHFIGVLEHVRDTLQPFARQVNSQRSTDPVANAFSSLSIEEPSEEFINAPDIPKSEPEYRAEPAQDQQEALTAFMLLLDDFNKIRTAVTDSWVKYSKGVLDIMVVSVTTNIAIEFARNMEENVTSLLDKQGGVEEIMRSLYTDKCLKAGRSPERRVGTKDEVDMDMLEECRSFLWPTYLILRGFVESVTPTKIPKYNPSIHGVYNATSERQTASQKFDNDKALLMKVFPRLLMLCRLREPLPVEDELVRGLRIAFHGNRITLCGVLSVQILLDIHHTMGEDMYRGIDDAGKAATQLMSSLSQHFKLHKSLKSENWPSTKEAAMHALLDSIRNWFKRDPVSQLAQRYEDQDYRDGDLLLDHPIFAGLLVYNMSMHFHDLSIEAVNAWGAVESCGYLYHDAHVRECLVREWKDMEVAGSLQTGWTSGMRAETIETSMKRWMLGYGYSASSFALNRRDSRQPPANRLGFKGLSTMQGVLQALKPRFISKGGSTNLTEGDLRKVLTIIDTWEEDSDLSEGELDNDIPGFVPYGLSKSVKPRDKKEKVSHERELRKLTITQLLEKLQQALQGEKIELAFDFLMLHSFCWRLLRALKEECADRLRDIYGYSYITKESQLPRIVGHILLSGLSPEEATRFTAFATARGGHGGVNLLGDAINVLNAMLGSGVGNIVTSIVGMQYNIGFE